LKYINATESIKEEIPKKSYYISNLFYKKEDNKIWKNFYYNSKKNENQFKKSNFKNKKFILKSFSENNLFLPYDNKTTNNKQRPFSTNIYPCRALTISKENGYNSPLTIIHKSKNKYNKKYSYNSKPKKKKLKLDDILGNNLPFKSHIDLLVERKENEFNIKLSHIPILSNTAIMNNFMKINFKNLRTNISNDNYYYVKSKLNSNTKCAENKMNNQEPALKFDNDKYKKFRTISKKLRNKIMLNDKKLSIKKLLEKIKKEKNVMNLERISQLKEDIEDNRILYTPKNFLKYKRDTFSFYKLNQLIQKLNSEFTYKNRYILANKLDIELDEYARKNKNKAKNKNTLH
jgi:hypothetical protein